MNPIFDGFMGTVQSEITNPFGLAAVAATGKHESGFSPRNAFRTWNDPSETGRPGTAGGIMSWNNDRLRNLQRFAAQVGDDPKRPSPQVQAQFFLREDPKLVQALNAAKSPEEATRLMNNAWRFAGYNRPGGEAAARLNTARQFAATGSFGDPRAAATGTGSAPIPPPREQMLAARNSNPMDGGLLSYASLGGGAPQQAPAPQPMAFAPSGNSGGMGPLPARIQSGDDGIPTAFDGIRASFDGGIPFAPQGDAGGNDPASMMMAALSQPKPLRETLGLVDELIGDFGAGGIPGADDERRNLAGIRGTLSADTDAAATRGTLSADTEGATARGREAAGGGLLSGLFDTRTDAAMIQSGEEEARALLNDGRISQDEYDRARRRAENRMLREEPDMLSNLVDDDNTEAAEAQMMPRRFDEEPGLVADSVSSPDSRGLFGPDPFAYDNQPMDASGPIPPLLPRAPQPDPFQGARDAISADRTIQAVRGGVRTPGADAALRDFSQPLAPPLPAPQEIATLPQPYEAPMPQPQQQMQPQVPQQPQVPPQQAINPNDWSGGEWIPPDIGMQLAQAQMRGGNMPIADAPAQGAMPAQGGAMPVPGGAQPPMNIDPQAQAASPAPAPVAQPQAAQPAQAASGEPNPMRQMFADMLMAVGTSLMETGDLRNVGRAMGALQQASTERRKSAQEQRAIGNALRMFTGADGNPVFSDEQINMFSGSPAAAKLGMQAIQEMTARQDAMRERTEMDSFLGDTLQPLDQSPVAVPEIPAVAPDRGVPVPPQGAEQLDAPAREEPVRNEPSVNPQISSLQQEIRGYENALAQNNERLATPKGQTPEGRAAIAEQARRIQNVIDQKRGQIAELTPASPDFSNIQAMTRAFEQETEPHAEVFRRFNEFTRLMTQKTAPSDNLLVQTVQRMFDPRMRRPGAQSEGETIGSSYIDRAANALALFMDGNVLTPRAREELLNIAEQYAAEYASDFEDLAEATRARTSVLFPNTKADDTIITLRARQFSRYQQAAQSLAEQREAQPAPPPPTGYDDSQWQKLWQSMTQEERRDFLEASQ
jgi:hypothetical protein